MDDALRSAGWIIVAVVTGAYVTYVTSDRAFNAKTASSTPIVVRDVLQKGQHHLYGKVIVQSSCDEVTEKTIDHGANTYELAFTSWTEPEVACIDTPTERAFDAVLFAPSIGVQITASLDKTPVPIAVYPILSN